MVRQADDSFVCFGAKPDKRFWTRDLGWPEVSKGTSSRELEKGARGSSWRGTTERPVYTGAERPVGWDEVQSSEGRRVKMSRHSSSVVEVSLETHASVSLQLHITLCRWSAKQTIPLSVLARNKTKGFRLEILAWPEVGKGTREERRTKELEEGVGEGWREWPVDSGEQRNESDEMRSRPVSEVRSR